MRSRSPALRTQLAGAMILAVLLAVVFGYVGLNLFGQWRERVLMDSLDVEAKRTLAVIDGGGEASARDVIALYRQNLRIARTIDRDQDRMLIILAAMGAALGVGVGLSLAARLRRPIEAIGRAARAIALGDLSARAVAPRPGAGELSTLLDDFNRMAEALQSFDREIKEGSAAIAHELRTPLTILKGRLQGHLDGVFPLDAAALRTLMEQIELLVTVVQDLQTLSMANTGTLRLRPERLDLARLAGSQVDALASALAGTGLRLETDLRESWALVDPDRFRQVLLALIDNARRYATSGGVVTVQTREEMSRAVLRVLDRGPGVPPGTEQLVFRRFWRAEPSRGRDHGGSGLGLAIVKAIVEAHGGEVDLKSREGGGVVVTARLPTGMPDK